MTIDEFEKRITDAAETLNLCAASIKEDDSFSAEAQLLLALTDLKGCKEFVSDWADAQEREIAKVEESKGYETVQ